MSTNFCTLAERYFIYRFCSFAHVRPHGPPLLLSSPRLLTCVTSTKKALAALRTSPRGYPQGHQFEGALSSDSSQVHCRTQSRHGSRRHPVGCRLESDSPISSMFSDRHGDRHGDSGCALRTPGEPSPHWPGRSLRLGCHRHRR